MNRLLIGSVLGLAALALTADTVDGQAAKPAKKGNWFLSYDQARAEAKKSGKPIFVVFRCQP